jgi:hypothetical protein
MFPYCSRSTRIWIHKLIFLGAFTNKFLKMYVKLRHTSPSFCMSVWKESQRKDVYHHHKHQGLDPLIRSVSRFTAALATVSLVFQLFSFLVVCSGMISRGFRFVAFFASFKSQFSLYSSILSSMHVIYSSRRIESFVLWS